MKGALATAVLVSVAAADAFSESTPTPSSAIDVLPPAPGMSAELHLPVNL
jgi:hypothetical protein